MSVSQHETCHLTADLPPTGRGLFRSRLQGRSLATKYVPTMRLFYAPVANLRRAQGPHYNRPNHSRCLMSHSDFSPDTKLLASGVYRPTHDSRSDGCRHPLVRRDAWIWSGCRLLRTYRFLLSSSACSIRLRCAVSMKKFQILAEPSIAASTTAFRRRVRNLGRIPSWRRSSSFFR